MMAFGFSIYPHCAMIFSSQSLTKIMCESIIRQKCSSIMAFSVSYRAAVVPYTASDQTKIHYVTGWVHYIQIGRKYQFLNIIDFGNIRSTSLGKSDVVGILSLRVISVEGSTSWLMYRVHQPIEPPIAAGRAMGGGQKTHINNSSLI